MKRAGRKLKSTNKVLIQSHLLFDFFFSLTRRHIISLQCLSFFCSCFVIFTLSAHCHFQTLLVPAHWGVQSFRLLTETSAQKSMSLQEKLNLFSRPQLLLMQRCLLSGTWLLFSLILSPFTSPPFHFFDFYTTPFILWRLPSKGKGKKTGRLYTWGSKYITEIS